MNQQKLTDRNNLHSYFTQQRNRQSRNDQSKDNQKKRWQSGDNQEGVIAEKDQTRQGNGQIEQRQNGLQINKKKRIRYESNSEGSVIESEGDMNICSSEEQDINDNESITSSCWNLKGNDQVNMKGGSNHLTNIQERLLKLKMELKYAEGDLEKYVLEGLISHHEKKSKSVDGDKLVQNLSNIKIQQINLVSFIIYCPQLDDIQDPNNWPTRLIEAINLNGMFIITFIHVSSLL